MLFPTHKCWHGGECWPRLLAQALGCACCVAWERPIDRPSTAGLILKARMISAQSLTAPLGAGAAWLVNIHNARLQNRVWLVMRGQVSSKPRVWQAAHSYIWSTPDAADTTGDRRAGDVGLLCPAGGVH
jgi:hypothetical protein